MYFALCCSLKVNNQIKSREGYAPGSAHHRCKEMSEFTSSLCKDLYLFPKYYPNNQTHAHTLPRHEAHAEHTALRTDFDAVAGAQRTCVCVHPSPAASSAHNTHSHVNILTPVQKCHLFHIPQHNDIYSGFAKIDQIYFNLLGCTQKMHDHKQSVVFFFFSLLKYAKERVKMPFVSTCEKIHLF